MAEMMNGFIGIAIISVWLGVTYGIPTYPTPSCSVSEEIDSVYLYSCNYGTIPSPLSYTAFADPIPQRLRIYNVNGALNSGHFSGFSSFDMTAVSSDFTTFLSLQCSVGGTLTLQSTTFTDFSYLQELEILGCSVNLPSSVFQGIAILNRLTIRGGTISTIDAAAFTGLSIQPVANYPEPMGQLSFQKLTLGSALPATVFSNLGAARWIKLENIGLTSVDSSLFSSNTAIRGISLRDNAITTLPDSLFNGLDGLSELDQSNVPWECSCGNLAFLSTLRKNNINVIGAPVCSTGENADNYYNSSCVTNSVCGDTPGLAIGGNCMFIGMLIGLIIIAIGLIFAIVALGLTCHLRKKIALQDPKRKKKAPPPPGSNPRNVANKGRRGSGWV